MRRSCVAAVLVLPIAITAILLAGSAAGDSTPNFPPLPPIHVHLPHPQAKAFFDVVVEGEATDRLDSQLSGETGTCLYTEDATVKEGLTYQRGKGVTVEFDRYGNEALVHRSGRESDSSLSAKLTQKKTATGGSQASPAHPPAPCGVPPVDLSQNGDCNKPFHDDGKLLLAYEDGGLLLTIGHTNGLSVVFEENKCGIDPQTGITAQSAFTWPNLPPLERAPLPIKKIFGKKHVLVVPMRSSDVGKEKREKRDVTGGALKGFQVETAFNKATVRLIRKGH
ncbi:MAG TPA: hypothetical protein VH476_10120 [Solirubrobacterales bacterium]|jgi:hypothetical protein